VAFKWDIDAGQLCVAAAMLVSVTAYIVSGHDAVGHLTNDVQETKAKVQETKTELSLQIQGLRSDIKNLPDVSAQTGILDRRTTALESHAQSTDDKLSDVTARVTGVEASLRQQPSYRAPR
jgi:hypothetical protein